MWEVFAIPSLFGALLLWNLSYKNHQRLKSWRDDIRLCGLHLEHETSSMALQIRLKAKNDPIGVTIEDVNQEESLARVIVSLPALPGIAGVRLWRETSRPSAREVEIGDETFDATFSIEGPTRLIATLLDDRVRALLMAVNAECQVTIQGGEIRATLRDPQLRRMLAVLLIIVRRFAEKPDVAERLAENARDDREPGVRLNCLLVLIREFPGDPRTAEALRLAGSDPSPRNRLRAAREMGEEGRPILQDLAEGLADDDCSAQAVALLEPDLTFEKTRTILAGSLRKRRVRTARACLEALGRWGAGASADAVTAADAVKALTKVMTREQGELAAAAATALGEAGSPASEPALIEALRRESVDIRVAAANALGRLGSAAAVLPLKEADEGFGRAAELRTATRQAVAEIQARLQGASGATPGQLSLADAEAGQLSLADADTGQLSLAADDPAGQLSLSDENGGTRAP